MSRVSARAAIRQRQSRERRFRAKYLRTQARRARALTRKPQVRFRGKIGKDLLVLSPSACLGLDARRRAANRGRACQFQFHESRQGAGIQSAFAPDSLTTFAHFSVSSANSLAKSAGEPGSGVPPSSAMRALILGSAKAALSSRLSVSTMAAGVPAGAAMPYHALAS